ncbi:MAG: hypothetical protein WEE89_01955 [Gemmatimonadota bacterium]
MSDRYYAISDESQITASRFRSIASVSLPVSVAASFNDRASECLEKSRVSEFKWHELKSAKRRFCAMRLIDRVLDDLLAIDGRIDVVVWDTQDSRHSVEHRDDDKNFERMYFHLHKTLMLRRPLEAEWHLRPDERFGIDWRTLQECLHSVGSWRKYYEQTLLAEEFSVAQFHVKSLKQVSSCDLPLCQVADLFAGMAAYTRTHGGMAVWWQHCQAGQGELIDEATARRVSSADRERLPVICYFNERCKEKRLGVSLATHGYLFTPSPANPLNFWHYMPQHSSDQAPAKWRDGSRLPEGQGGDVNVT